MLPGARHQRAIMLALAAIVVLGLLATMATAAGGVPTH
jgi:hypothetical protein